MTRLLTAAGVDAVQWRALTRAFLKVDFATVLGAYGQRAAGRSALSLITTAVIYTMSGLVPAAMIYLTFDHFLGATLMTTQVAFVVGASLLLSHGSAIVSPDDHEVLGFRPIASRTYLAVRVTVLLIHTLFIAALAGYTPVAAFLIKEDARLAGMLGALVAVAATAVATALTLVVVYGWLLRLVGPTRLARVLSYAQLLAGFVIYGGIPLAFYVASREIATDLTLDQRGWVLFYPGAWFASYVDLALGRFTPVSLGLAALSVGLLAALTWMVGGKLSLDYSDRLGRLATDAVDRPARPRSRFRFLAGETRAIALLVRAQFRHDLKFRLGVLSLVPVTILYLYLGSTSGDLVDPFGPGGGHAASLGLVQFALLILPISLRRALVASDAYRASWIFHATPSDRTRLIVAGRDVVAAVFLVPYLAVLAVVFTYLFGHVGHAVLHTIFLGWMSYLVLQVTVLVDPRLPFSMPLTRETRAGMAFGVIFVALVVGQVIYAVLIAVVYASTTRVAVALAAFAVATVVLDRRTRARVARTAAAYIG